LPQELAIILVVIVGAIWLLVKIGQGISNLINQSSKSYDQAIAKRREKRFLKGRKDVGQHIHIHIPNALDSIESKFELARKDFEQTRASTNWVARPLPWTKKKFPTVTLPAKHEFYADMCIDDIAEILTPNSETSMWSYEESQIINHHCKYPFPAPSAHVDEFVSVATFEPAIATAIFEFDSKHVHKKDVDAYFTLEQTQVTAYNDRRASLVAKISALNAQIKTWNARTRTSWEAYGEESKKIENRSLVEYKATADTYTEACQDQIVYFRHLQERFKNGKKESVIERIGLVVDRILLPASIPHTWEVDFDEEERIAVIDLGLPDVVHRPPYKCVALKSGTVNKPLNQSEKREFIPKVHPAILLRTAYEVFRNDPNAIIKLLVVNGWVKFDDPATGINTKAYTASLMVARNQIETLNLNKIDPITAFNNLHGKSAGKLVEIIPIEPMLSMNRKDSRFVDAKAILNSLGTETNLAAMDWQDFEHLIRELFEKEFSGRGAEVKVTQTSRDRGVDAIVFDPDPIRGGKFVIQAKRYTNTVDVSAVRDLCAVVKKEGASRGILVTTSTYGADAYAFANNEPITLLNGAELLGLLRKHGYSFRINLQEARRLT